MEFLLIIPIGIYMIFLIPAFMFTWEGSVFEGIGCYGWVCMFIGFPGAILALIIKGVIKLINLPEEKKAEEERRIRQRQQEEEERKYQEQAAAEQKVYQDSLVEKRNKIYPNSPITAEIVKIITQSRELPYSIELNKTGLTFYYENGTKSYVFRAHGLPNMDRNEEEIFANVLNQKLNNRYLISEITKYDSFPHGDGTFGGCTIHLGTRMELKVTRNF